MTGEASGDVCVPCTLLTHSSFLIPQHSACTVAQAGWETPVPGEGKGWRWGQFLLVRLRVAVVMDRNFWGEIQHQALSLSLVHRC